MGLLNICPYMFWPILAILVGAIYTPVDSQVWPKHVATNTNISVYTVSTRTL